MDDTPHLEERIIMALKTVYDPEIPVDIYELGLIYGVDVTPEQIPPEVEQKVAAVEGVRSAKAEIVWEPMWTKEMMTEVAKLQLGFF